MLWPNEGKTCVQVQGMEECDDANVASLSCQISAVPLKKIFLVVGLNNLESASNVYQMRWFGQTLVWCRLVFISFKCLQWKFHGFLDTSRIQVFGCTIVFDTIQVYKSWCKIIHTHAKLGLVSKWLRMIRDSNNNWGVLRIFHLDIPIYQFFKVVWQFWNPQVDYFDLILYVNCWYHAFPPKYHTDVGLDPKFVEFGS